MSLFWALLKSEWVGYGCRCATFVVSCRPERNPITRAALSAGQARGQAAQGLACHEPSSVAVKLSAPRVRFAGLRPPLTPTARQPERTSPTQNSREGKFMSTTSPSRLFFVLLLSSSLFKLAPCLNYTRILSYLKPNYPKLLLVFSIQAIQSRNPKIICLFANRITVLV